MDKISIVVPCYNEEEALEYFYAEMKKVMKKMKEVAFELLFVDDGSEDQTLAMLRKMAELDPRCRYLSFSRNFGKEAAIYAGLSHASGNYVAIMDADLQDPPGLLPEMYQMLYWENWDCVAARRKNREGEPRLKSFLSDCFYKVINKLSKIQLVSGARDFRMMTRRMVNGVLQMSEYNRFSKGLFQWVGFRTAWIEFPNQERCAGKSKWPLRKLISYSLEGITGFSVAPLSLAAVMGLLFCVISFFMIGFIAFRTLFFGDPVKGWPSMACIIFLVGGIQLFCIGILGEYLAKTYLETKRRPIYILRETSEDNCKEISRGPGYERTAD